MLDILNDNLLLRGEEPIAFDSDCREGICGVCCLTINGEAHGPDHPSTACELYMRRFRDGATIRVEPFRARPFPIVKDLVIDRSALDRIVQAGGFISARVGSAPEANLIAVPKHDADLAMEAQLASVAVLVWQRVQMLPRCCLRAQKFRISHSCLRAHRNAIAASCAWFAQWMPKVSKIAQTFTNASQCARRRFPEASWQRCIANTPPRLSSKPWVERAKEATKSLRTCVRSALVSRSDVRCTISALGLS